MKTIFFDLDDTLYFRRDAFFIAFDDFFNGKHADSKLYANDRCRIRGDEVFYDAQKGTISSEEMYRYRFKTGLSDAGIEISSEQAMQFYYLYKKALYEMKLNPPVISMLDFAKSNFEALGIMTNGESSHQRNKIKNLGLEKWIKSELIVISGEHGCPKPDRRLFEISAKKAGNPPEDLIIVGDSFNNDIIPAHELGWHTVWIDLYNENLPPPEYSAKNIKEILEILEKY